MLSTKTVSQSKGESDSRQEKNAKKTAEMLKFSFSLSFYSSMADDKIAVKWTQKSHDDILCNTHSI